jgi:glycosyltransferase involved in cell wall biosynthesis
VVHVHSTEFDRSGERVNQAVYDIEREGMHAADAVVAVSGRTRQMCVERYGVAPQKVSVVYNAVDPPPEAGPDAAPEGRIKTGDKVVLFLGRITMQKGPEYFLAAAKKVLEKIPDVKFVMAGAGDMVHRMVELAAGLGIGHRVLFTGFLSGEEVDRAFQRADLYVMPSVSEPFGITPLEALGHDVPVIISKQSGVSEVLSHVLKVDFWDIHELANKMIAVLRHGALHRLLRENGSQEVRRFSWLTAARQCVAVYRRAMAWRAAWGGESEGNSAVPAPPGAWHGAGA